MPKEGDISAGYGWAITINVGNKYINEGINIEMSNGDSVKASNTGKVIFADNMPYYGNVIVIDHGMGIKTWYGHLGTIEVKSGDGVIKGQQIGTGGATGTFTSGLATSPSQNLFFAVSVKNIFINPVTFIANGVPGVDNISSGVSLGSVGFDENIDDSSESDIPEAAPDGSPENEDED